MRKIMLIIISLIVPTISLISPAGAMAQKPSGNKGNTETVTVEKSQIIRDSKENKLKFFNDEGKLINEISLGNKESAGKILDKQKNKQWDVLIKVYNYAKVSQNKQYAVILTRNVEEIKKTKEYIEEYKESVYTPATVIQELTFFNKTGKLLWKETLSVRQIFGWADEYIKVSNTGLVAVLTTEEKEDPDPINNILYVYNRNKMEEYRIPSTTIRHYPYGNFEISSNGKYIGLASVTSEGKETTLFVDLQTKNFWDANQKCKLLEVLNDGSAEVISFDGKKKIIDFKKYLEK